MSTNPRLRILILKVRVFNRKTHNLVVKNTNQRPVFNILDEEDEEYGDETDNYYSETEPTLVDDTGYSPQSEISSATNYDATESSGNGSNTLDQDVKYEDNEIEETGEEDSNTEYNLEQSYPEKTNIEYEAAAANADVDTPIEIETENIATPYPEINTDVDQGDHKPYAETTDETYDQPEEAYSDTDKDDGYGESSTNTPYTEPTDNTYPAAEPIETPYTEAPANAYSETDVVTPDSETIDEIYPGDTSSVPYPENKDDLYKENQSENEIPYEEHKVLPPYESTPSPVQQTYEDSKPDVPYKDSPEYQPSTEAPTEYPEGSIDKHQ